VTRVGGSEPKAKTSLGANGPSGVPAAVPLHEPPSPPLTPDDRESIEGDLEDQRRSLARHANTEPVADRGNDCPKCGRNWRAWSNRYWMLAQEIVRLEDQLAEDDLNIINHGCLAAVLAGGETWQRFMADAEQRMGVSWAEIKVLLDERYANRTKATA
jgi:hypothetical protein